MNNYRWWLQCPMCSLERDHDYLPQTWLDTGSGIRFWQECVSCDDSRQHLLEKKVGEMVSLGILSPSRAKEMVGFLTNLLDES